MNQIDNSVAVSIIVPVLNTRKYIKECLDSLSGQTLKNIEIICVDGGSTDGSLEIIEEYSKKDKRFHLVTDTKGSYGAQLNRGIELAKGDYIAIAEPDDYVSEEMYEALYKEAVTTDSDIVKGDYCRFIGDGSDRFYFPKSACKEEWYGKDLNARREKDLLESTPANWSGIYKKSFLEKEKIFHNTTRGAAYQDLGFWFLATALAGRIRFIPVNGYYYRIDNPDSSINSSNKENCLKNELEWLEEQLKDRDLFDEYYSKYQRIKQIHTGWMNRKTEGVAKTECFKAITNSKPKSCVLFGCGADGVEYLVTLKSKGLIDRINCLTDNDRSLWGKRLLEIPVVNPKDALMSCKKDTGREAIFIISSTRYKESIQKQLEEYGVKRENIFQIGV